MANYLITGGTGLIATALIKRLLQADNQVTVLTRDLKMANKKLPAAVKNITHLNNFDKNEGLDYVINLAGEPIADKRWSAGQKLKLWHSRIALTSQLVSWIKTLNIPPKALISGSAVGWYGDSGAQILTEKSTAVDEYSHTLCQAWEEEALKLVNSATRVCVSRTGLVLSQQGGFLAKMKLPFQLGLGARLGDGQQYMSWIHIDDMVRALIFLIADNRAEQALPNGIFNLTSPYPVTNKKFSHLLAAQLNRFCIFVMPAIFLKVILGEMAQLLLGGQRVLPQHLTDQGFNFDYPSMDQALKSVLSNGH